MKLMNAFILVQKLIWRKLAQKRKKMSFLEAMKRNLRIKMQFQKSISNTNLIANYYGDCLIITLKQKDSIWLVVIFLKGKRRLLLLKRKIKIPIIMLNWNFWKYNLKIAC